MNNRPTLIQRLQATFDENPELKQKCFTNSKEYFRRGMANRVFDDFPCLVSDEQYKLILSQYNQLLQNGRPIDVRKFEKQLIKIACDELLDEHGELNQDLMNFLEWSEYASKIDNYNAVSAFVGMMNIYLSTESRDLVLNHQYEYSAMTSLVNKNFGKWIREYMCEKGIHYDPCYETGQLTAEKVLLYPVRHPLFALSLFAGGIVGAGVYGAVKGCQKVYEEYAPLNLPGLPSL